MNEYRTQRNVLLTLVAVLAAVGIGFWIGRSGRSERLAETAETAAIPHATSPAVADSATNPSGASAETSATERETAPPTASGSSAPASPALREEPAPSPRPTPRRARPTDSAPRPPVPGVEASEASETAPEPEPVREPVAPAPVIVTVPAGTRVELALLDPVSSQTAAVGDEVRAEVTQAIRVDGREAIPAGSIAAGRVTEVRALGKVGGKALLAVTFDEIAVAGDRATIAAAWRGEGKSETAKDAATIAAGAAVGTVAGNQTKHNDKGKVIGAILGAAIGTAIAAKTEGQPVALDAGSHLTLTLRESVDVRLGG